MSEPVNPSQFDRDTLATAITAFLANQDHLETIRAAIEAEIDAGGAQALADLNARLAKAGDDWTYYERDPLARRIHQRYLRGSRRFRIRHVQATARITLPSLSASQIRPVLKGIGA